MTGESSESLFRYDGKRALVVGGSSGMGLATAKLVADLGGAVTVLDIQEPLEPVESYVAVDLRDRQSIDAALGSLDGSIDALFSCAGVADGTPGLAEINFVGQRHLIESALAAGSVSAGGAIAMISSIGGMGWENQLEAIGLLLGTAGFEDASAWFADHPDLATYTFSKQAVIAYCASRGPALGREGIRINCTAPGPVLTPLMDAHEEWQQFEMGVHAAIGVHGATPEQQAYPLAFLNSAAASYVNGTCLVVDAGFVPGAVTGAVDSPIAQMFAGER
jgi:NAD(P)-dependent dehydrogenase (short-subunit alcohol dehydrogenase family)